MTDRTRRRHPARNTRIAALGLSATTMLGLTAAFGVTARAAADESVPMAAAPVTAAPSVAPPPPLEDARHSTLLVARAIPTTSAEPTPVATTRPTPTAAPRPAPRPAPVARSNGSR